jgi:hypothetical protein
MKFCIPAIFFLIIGTNCLGQINIYSPQFKVLNTIIGSIDNFKSDKVFEKYALREKKNIYYSLKDMAINYLTIKQKFKVDTNKKYTFELKDVIKKQRLNIYDIKDTAKFRIGKGDLIISIFQPNYFNGYFYVVAYARTSGSGYGDRITNFLFILNNQIKIVKYYYIREVI